MPTYKVSPQSKPYLEFLVDAKDEQSARQVLVMEALLFEPSSYEEVYGVNARDMMKATVTEVEDADIHS